ncbi:hypothetical protein NQS96_13255 [Pseudoalteromonas shioyasakiensis]|uniref:hypothetical protein n=1 Tax=Pseudoalteromonas shioyasakiensis TaxID=1190813 RepID=UPI002117A64B|nr:hypothetical protein [Pseudoalteromonas shioyasakiensis]MCQ8882742.1 hypothetical protein [Pseudoalteromonas shioyasakiensis]
MESIVTQSNDGFKDGEFQFSETKWLPWPSAIKPDFAAVRALDSDDNVYFPDPYANDGSYVKQVSHQITYYNADGTIKWNTSITSIFLHTGAQLGYGRINGIFHLINGVPHFVGTYALDNTNYCFYAINLDDREIIKGNWFDPNLSAFQQFGILEDNTLVAMCLTSNNAVAKAFEVDDAMNLGNEIVGCGYVSNLSTTTSGATKTALIGVPLFNGCVSLLHGFYANSNSTQYDLIGMRWGINASLDFTGSDIKTAVKTTHDFAHNSFTRIWQLSKDIFVQYRDKVEAYVNYAPSGNTYYHRSDLESWASDSLYATHSIRIPKREV